MFYWFTTFIFTVFLYFYHISTVFLYFYHISTVFLDFYHISTVFLDFYHISTVFLTFPEVFLTFSGRAVCFLFDWLLLKNVTLIFFFFLFSPNSGIQQQRATRGFEFFMIFPHHGLILAPYR
jgi:hypothetical protein